MDFFVKCLAVLGGAVLGGWVVGWAIGWVGRSWFKDQKIPAFIAWATRLLGAVLAGLLTFYLVFGGGGAGLGGSGGLSVGTKNGKKDGKEPSTKDKKRPRELDTGGKQGSTTLRVEVLSDAVLKKLAGDKEIDRAKCYRLNREGAPVALDDVKKAIKAGIEAKPPLARVEIILYKDSPIEDVAAVRDLDTMARDVGDGLKVDISKPGVYAPPPLR